MLIGAISVSDEAAIIRNGYRFIPDILSLKAYEYLLKDVRVIGRAYGVTIFVTLVGSTLNVMFNSMYAYSLSRKDFPFKSFFNVAVLLTLLFNGGIPTFYFFYVRVYHLKDTLMALLLPGLGAGFYIFVMRTYFRQNVPAEVIESAKMDGASESRTFFSIVLPLSLPILATIALFSAINYWNDFFNSLLFIENNKLSSLQYTMQKALMSLDYLKRMMTQMGSAGTNVSNSVAAQVPSESVRMAMVIFGVGPVVAVYPFLQKYFVRGLTIGSVKG